jgi:hypothetical protein
VYKRGKVSRALDRAATVVGVSKINANNLIVERHYLPQRARCPPPPNTQSSKTSFSPSPTVSVPGPWQYWRPLEQRSLSRGTRRHLTSVKTKYKIRLKFEPGLILTLTKIRPRIGMLEFQKQAQSSH